MRRRRLPHLDGFGTPVFVTFRLHGSLPAGRAFPAQNLTSGEAFAAMDRLLDQARQGPTFLQLPEIAGLVAESIRNGKGMRHYEAHAWVIMPNHVHMLISPHVSLSRLMGSLKGATARRANELLQRIGRPFWQDESYDHVVRSEEECGNIRRYIENNPVRAGLVRRVGDYLWSSAGAA